MNIPLSLTLVLICLGLSSCATPANPEAMTPASVMLHQKFNKSVSVTVSGGQKTNPLMASQVDNESFAAALKNAIERNQAFSKVIATPDGDCLLDVRLVRLQQPLFGLSLTVTAEAEWQLSKAGRKVWQETIRTPHTTTMGEAFSGVKRLRLANEGAIQSNIKTGLEKISRQSL